LPTNSPYPKHKRHDKKQTRRKPWQTNNNTTPQPKWHGHAQDANKTVINHNKSPKYQNNKTNNKHHDSFPMIPNASKGKLNLSLLQIFHGNLFSMQFLASYCHQNIIVSANINITIH